MLSAAIAIVMDKLAQAQAQYQDFVAPFQSLVLSTITADGLPHASYAPFVVDEDKTFYLFVSGLSEHTQNLRSRPHASILFIEDESQTQNLFARRRLTYDCAVSWLERETDSWIAIADRFQDQFGEIIGILRSLGDFEIVSLQPRSGRFVIGFGAAYQIQGENLDQLVQLKG